MVRKKQTRTVVDADGWMTLDDYAVKVRWDNQPPAAERRVIEIKSPNGLISKVTRVLSGKKWDVDGGTQLFELPTADGCEQYRTFDELMLRLGIKPR